MCWESQVRSVVAVDWSPWRTYRPLGWRRCRKHRGHSRPRPCLPYRLHLMETTQREPEYPFWGCAWFSRGRFLIHRPLPGAPEWRKEFSLPLHPGFQGWFLLRRRAGEEVSSFAADSSAATLSNSPLASVSSSVLTPDDFFLFFLSSDVLSLDFLGESEFGFPTSAFTEQLTYITTHLLLSTTWDLLLLLEQWKPVTCPCVQHQDLSILKSWT